MSSSGVVTCPSRRLTNPAGTSIRRGSGTPTACACATAGWWCSTFSISRSDEFVGRRDVSLPETHEPRGNFDQARIGDTDGLRLRHGRVLVQHVLDIPI